MHALDLVLFHTKAIVVTAKPHESNDPRIESSLSDKTPPACYRTRETGHLSLTRELTASIWSGPEKGCLRGKP